VLSNSQPFTTSSLDLVIRVGQPTEELRYTIRALAKHLPYRNLWTAGTYTPWLTCPHINVPNGGGKYEHAHAVLMAVLDSDQLADDVILADDDMFLLEPLATLPAYYNWTLDQAPIRGRRQALNDTMRLVGTNAPCREIHAPSVVNRSRLKQQFDDINLSPDRKARLMWRTIHANGTPQRMADTKVRLKNEAPSSSLWVSTHTDSWNGLAGEFIRAQFPEPSRYERP